MFKELKIKSAIHYHDSKFATNWDLNIYRGCEHKCKYCFAQYSHKFLEDNSKNFFDDVYVLDNISKDYGRAILTGISKDYLKKYKNGALDAKTFEKWLKYTSDEKIKSKLKTIDEFRD